MYEHFGWVQVFLHFKPYLPFTPLTELKLDVVNIYIFTFDYYII